MNEFLAKIDLPIIISLAVLIVGDGGIVGIIKWMKEKKREKEEKLKKTAGSELPSVSAKSSRLLPVALVILLVFNVVLIGFIVYQFITPAVIEVIDPPIYEYSLKTDDTVCITGVNQKELADLVIPSEIDGKAISEIADHSFDGCSANDIAIPASVEAIGDNAFANCKNLINVNVDENNTYYTSDHGILFNDKKTKLIYYPDGKKLGEIVISGECGSEAKWRLYDSGVLLIAGKGKMADYEKAEQQPWAEYRNNITSVVFDGYITHIGDRVFLDCSNIRFCILPESITEIGLWSFSHCNSMEEIIIPSSVVSIKMGAFEKSENIKTVVLGKSLRELDRTFMCDCRKTESITVSSDNPYFTSIDGALYNKDVTDLILIPKGISGQFIIPDTVEVIGNYACQFSNYSEIVLPSSLKSFGFASMSWCDNMTSITIPLSVKSINKWAFRGDYNLADIYYQGAEQDWKKIQIDKTGMNETKNAALLNATIHYQGEQQ